jgi:dTDP-4-amino-4,6-dideoxygalactose transaminase
LQRAPIIVTHLFGQPADLAGIMKVARRRRLAVIEDAAQSPGIRYRGRPAGTIGDIGVFSLNCHKVIQTGEGGVAVTRDPELARRLQLIRNHAEAVLGGGLRVRNMKNMVGFNYRMTEIEAAIGREQLKRLRGYNARRARLADRLSRRLARLPGITPPQVRTGAGHGYYVYAVLIDPANLGVSRDVFARALQAEGIPVSAGYLRPLYMLPIYRQRILFGSVRNPGRYRAGSCPVTESVQRRLIGMEFIRDPLGPSGSR